MFWLVDMRLHFYFAASDLFLGLGYSDNICTCILQSNDNKAEEVTKSIEQQG